MEQGLNGIQITTLVMQDGFLGGLFGVENTGPLLAFLPVITIGLLYETENGF
jgi:hypothetical protein